MPKILLHACCAICASHPYFLLNKLGYDVTLLFYNPNIYPAEEYNRRLQELKKFSELNNIKLIIENEDYEKWLNVIKGYEEEPEKGKRCSLCFKERLYKTKIIAEKQCCELYTTTLSVSPHKSSAQIFSIAKEIDSELNNSSKFLEIDFKKQDGFLKTSSLAKEYGFYRQNYCGCSFSIR